MQAKIPQPVTHFESFNILKNSFRIPPSSQNFYAQIINKSRNEKLLMHANTGHIYKQNSKRGCLLNTQKTYCMHI